MIPVNNLVSNSIVRERFWVTEQVSVERIVKYSSSDQFSTVLAFAKVATCCAVRKTEMEFFFFLKENNIVIAS